MKIYVLYAILKLRLRVRSNLKHCSKFAKYWLCLHIASTMQEEYDPNCTEPEANQIIVAGKTTRKKRNANEIGKGKNCY